MTHHLRGGLVEYDSQFGSSAWLNFYQAILRDQVTGVQQLKHDGTTTVYIAEIDGVRCVVKRYNTKNTWHFIRRGFRRSRADICYQMARVYDQAGISTPRPIAQIQAKSGPFKRRSWYICEWMQGALLEDVVHQHFSGGSDTAPTDAAASVKLPSLLSEAQCLFEKLATHRLSHGDMKATNLIWHQDQLHMIDLDAAHQHQRGASQQRAFQKDTQRFIKNWDAYPELQQSFKAALESVTLNTGE